MGKKKLTPVDINERIKHRGLSLIGEYVSNKVKSLYSCVCGNEWLARTDSILNGRGCPTCYNNYPPDQRLSIDQINERLAPRGLSIIGPYDSNKTKTLFTCLLGHVWEARPDNVMSGSRCIYCKHPLHPGFGGYKTNLPGWSYVLEYETFIKYGITNVPLKRLRTHKKSGEYVIRLLRRHDDGAEPLKWEQNIKKRFGGSYVGPDIMLTGYTETLSKELLNEIIK